MQPWQEKYQNYQIAPGPLRALSFRVLCGANYFSAGPVVVLRLDLGEYHEVFTDRIPGFAQRLRACLPSLAAHHCSVGRPEGFFVRVEEGTLLGHVVEHVAIELQTLAGMDVAYGKTRSTGVPGVYNVVYRFFDEMAGLYAGRAAVNLVNSLLLSRPFAVEEITATLVDIREARLLGPSTAAIVAEAERRGLPWLRLDEYNLVQLGTGRYQKRIRATITSNTRYLGVDSADDKYLATILLRDAGIPVPETRLAESLPQAQEIYGQWSQPLVVKPLTGAQGRGVSLNVDSAGALAHAFHWAARFSPQVVIQPQIAGTTFRLLVIDHKLVAASSLQPPAVLGDGERSIAELVEDLNRTQNRQVGDKATLTRVEIDEITLELLRSQGLSPDSVLPAGKSFVLKPSGSLRLGGRAADVTDRVHADNRFLAERASRILGLDVAGVDIVAEDIGRSILDGTGAVIEVNAAPDFRMHLMPAEGQPRPVAVPFLDMLFPQGQPGRIPIISVTGTLGKTTAVSLMAHCLKLARLQVGLTSTEGLYISGRRLLKGDGTYPEQVALVLKDPTIDCAVLETSREGILRRGLGYSRADVGVVLNIFDDHVGADDIQCLEDLAYAKAVVVEQVYDQGYAVLNADIPLVAAMAERVRSQIFWFSRQPSRAEVRAHIRRGGAALLLEDNEAIGYRQGRRIRLFDIRELPLCYGGRAELNYDAILASAAALMAYGLEPENIRYGFKSFYPDPQMLPGRLNLLSLGEFQVLVDYAHNQQSFLGLQNFLRTFPQRKIGVLDAAGDRRDAEIFNLGRLAAGMFDRLILYEGHDLRGRAPGYIVELLRQGALAQGKREQEIDIRPEPEAAWEAGLSLGQSGTLVVILSGRSQEVLAAVERWSLKTK